MPTPLVNAQAELLAMRLATLTPTIMHPDRVDPATALHRLNEAMRDDPPELRRMLAGYIRRELAARREPQRRGPHWNVEIRVLLDLVLGPSPQVAHDEAALAALEAQAGDLGGSS